MNRYFFWRRIHSLLGLWLVLFLIEHMLTNSQAALLFGENGMGFVHAVNFLKNLPYLPFIEVFLLGVPILLHGAWGVRYLMTSKVNSYKSGGAKPSLPEYGRNRAYTWQRITSWILLVGIIAHVGYMRFYRYPLVLNQGKSSSYFVRLDLDPGLYTVADRLGVMLYGPEEVEELKEKIKEERPEKRALDKEVEKVLDEYGTGLKERRYMEYSPRTDAVLSHAEKYNMDVAWVKTLSKKKLAKDQVMAVATDFGTATLLTVRDAFKSPLEGVLYTIFVLAAAFHGFNGLWTFMITWGVVLRMRSQKKAVNFCVGLIFLIAFLGLSSIWGTYWVNLKH